MQGGLARSGGKMPTLEQWMKPYADPSAPKAKLDWRQVKAGFADLAAFQAADRARRARAKAKAQSTAPIVAKPRKRTEPGS